MELVPDAATEETTEKTNRHPWITVGISTLAGAALTFAVEKGLTRWFSRSNDTDDVPTEETTEQE